MKYKIILFDVDDTLFDFSISEKNALYKAFVEFGSPLGLGDYEVSYKEISKLLWRDLEQGIITLSELGVERFRKLFLAHKLEIDANTFNSVYLGYLGKEIHLIPGAVEVCNDLADCRLAIITNGFTDVQKSRIEGSPLRNTFEHIIISEETGFQKPEQRIFEYAFSKLQITDKAKVLIVGDSLTSDIQGGINCGIDTCWFNPYCKENNIGIKPTYEIRELTDIIRIVGKTGN
ncbi:YjjG family noncanonical pyrimidine nucleotidase [Bacillus gaemokensis]|uniref:2-haloalkanoic acid dehalogenase n=1 Tax=Bacillus gaemokensis TaxID=574375 RepID=A0A073KLQ8_9BACI|nr:YjjG family noncanonical pyrimidine nucleotidase [Bacillus gaemokensis]KEK23283.1 2-haloalkanoic acid dehalogenase [Bacillus gaemokensis]KYG28969.1 2-haloalkanoic acid dehalogenase [Bacillus gaemokensis]